MFATLKSRILLGVYLFIVLSIPVGAYLASQTQTTKSRASELPKTNIAKKTTEATASASKEILNTSQSRLSQELLDDEEELEQDSSPTIATTIGPTLSLKALLEARPEGNQSTKLFVGIIEGVLSSTPKFLLSFTVDLDKTGSFTNLSLAGLNSGETYTALIKGSSQIATSSAFTMSPNVTNLNEGQPLTLLSGDLNEDNVINSADLAIAQKAWGATPGSSTWNENADFNVDGVINSFDIRVVSRNMNKVGASGAWSSPLPKTASQSATLIESINQGGTPGYWMWIPK